VKEKRTDEKRTPSGTTATLEELASGKRREPKNKYNELSEWGTPYKGGEFRTIKLAAPGV